MADRCEAFFNGRWNTISADTALLHPEIQSKRCVECHGEIRVHRQGKNCSAHVEHKQGNWATGFEGCSLLQGYKFSWKKQMHPKPLNKPIDVVIKGKLPPLKESEDEIAARLTLAASSGNTSGLQKSQKEGLKILKKSWTIERSAKNRQIAIDYWGNACVVCGMQFDNEYGEKISRGFIEVHHLKPLSLGQRKPDPQKELVPLCSNCHSMAHRRRPEPVPIKELRQVIRKKRSA